VGEEEEVSGEAEEATVEEAEGGEEDTEEEEEDTRTLGLLKRCTKWAISCFLVRMIWLLKSR